MASVQLLYGNQYFTTTLNVGGGIDDTQTTGIIISDVSGLDTAKPGMALINYADPLNTTIAEWVEYTSINGSKELVGVTRGSEGFSAKSHSNGVSVAFPLTESHINRIAQMFDSIGLDIKEISTPANPSSGRNKIYFKSGGGLYKLNSSGTESAVGSGSAILLFDHSNAVLPDANFASISKTVGTNWVYKTLDFDQTTSESVYWYFTVPSDLTISTATLKIQWTASSGSGTFTASVVTRSPSNDEVIDETTTPSSASAVTATDTLLATGDLHQIDLALTTTGWAAGDLIQMKFSRDISDTLSADAKVILVALELR